MIQLLFGTEPYLIDNKVSNAKKSVSEFGFAEFEEYSEEVEEYASQYPICDPKHIIVLYVHSLKNDNKMLKFLKTTDLDMNDIYIISNEVDKRTALYKYLEKNNMVYECNKVSDDDFRKFILLVIKNEGGQITEAAYNLFKDRCGYYLSDDITLYTIKIYLQQLMFANKEKKIYEETVLSIVPETLDHKVYALTNLLLQKNGDKLFSMLQGLIEDKENPIGMLSSLLRCFRLTYKAALFDELNEQKLGSILGAPAYQFKAALKYSPKIIEQALDLLQDSVNKIKGGAADPEVIMHVTLGKLLSLLDS